MTLKKCLVAALLMSAGGAYAQEQNPPAIFSYVEQMPKSGYDLGQYLGDNIHYPDSARLAGIEGKVIVKFTVDEEGKITDAKVTKSLDRNCDAEALRVIRKMPPWKPGTQSGKPVKVFFTLPINFKLTNEEAKPPVYSYVTQMPKAPADLQAYLKKNIQYPKSARTNGVEGKVLVRFVVNEDGSVSDAFVLDGIGSGCDEEALRVVSHMPKWTPGMQEGKLVKVYYTLPIMFRL